MSDAPAGTTAPAPAGATSPATGLPGAPPSPLIAAGFMVAAAAIIAITTLIAKSLGTATLGPPMHPLQVTFGRYLFGAASIAVVALWLRPRIQWGLWRLHGVRVAFGWAGVTCMFAAVASIPLAEATAISFLNPIVAMVLAVLFLRERVGPWRWIAAAIALTGAVVLLRPGSGAIAPGALLALGAAFLLGAEIMMIKRLTRLDSPLAILCWSNGLGAIISAAVVWSVWAAPTPGQWAAMAGLGVAMACAQGCFVQAMARGEASFVTPFSYLTLVFAAAYDLALFGVLPDGAGWVGAALILSGAILLAWREARLRA